ncbi:DUF1624 domain-containing protein [Candidatus Woesearchaeota archaeon]|nr:DUF1624 domain-containing protein [Candidatus Woesearchaeota archaeon]
MPSVSRWQALDIVKAFGVLLMIVLHVVMWWYIPFDYGSDKVDGMFFFFLPFLKLIGLFVIIIPITAGASLRYFLKNNFNDGIALLKIIKRSFFLIIIGYAINLLAWGGTELLDWDVLQFVGVSLILTALMARFLPVAFVWIAGALALFSAPLLRIGLDKWKLNYFVAILIGNNEGNFFWPFFPWFSFVAYGFLIAHCHLKYGNGKSMRIALQACGIAAVALALLRGKLFFVDDIRNIWGPGIFQAPTLTLLANIGVFNLLLAYGERIKSIKTRKFGIFNVFSRGILWIYVVHIAVGYHIIRLIQSQFSKSPVLMAVAFVFVFALSYLTGAAAVHLKGRRKLAGG